MRRKYVAFTLGVVMTGMLLAGCGGSTDNASSADIASSKDASSSSDSDTSDTSNENTIYGKVTKVDGSTITYEVMERSGGGEKPTGSARPQGSSAPDGEAPSESGTPDENAKPDGTPPAQPDGSAMPQGSGAPSGKGQRGGGFASTGETKTLTVEDDTTIKIVSMKQGESEATDGSLSDIAVDTMIQIQYTDSDLTTIKEIDISKMEDRQNMKKEDAAADATSSPVADV